MATASAPLLPLLIEADDLHAHLDDPQLLIVDLSSSDNYQRQHIPGAVHIPPSALQCGIKPATGKLPPVEQLTELFSRCGIDRGKHVVVYDDEGGGWAGRMIWTLDLLGHTRYSYLNGGIHAWADAGLPVSSTTETPVATTFEAQFNRRPIAEIEDVLAAIANPDCAIWDARSAAEYRGEKVLAERGGHIPGAIHLDWLDLIDRDNAMRLVDLEQLRLTLQQLGLTPDKTVITHCQTHHRSGLSYLAMKLLGYPAIKGYHGSWSEWGNRPELPVTTD